MQKLLLLGDEAIAQGAIDAGLSGIYAYPGTPSTEITEYVQSSKKAQELNIRSEWSANEKTAMEAAIGMSYAGKRAMVCMKHVGLNVAADAFVNSGITGANGGLVVVSADDPSMHSSQNEQDSRFYGKFALIPTLEPHDQQQAYDMVHYAFDISEQLGTPVLIRIVTRLAHSRSAVQRKETIRQQNKITLPSDLSQYILLPAMARKRYRTLINKQDRFLELSETGGYNTYHEGSDKSLGIIVSGLAYNYLMENYGYRKVPYPVLQVGQYPVPEALVRKMDEEVDEFMVIEEGFPFIEEQLKGLLSKNITVKGRLDGSLPRTGELNPNIVAKALGLESGYGDPVPSLAVSRPPELCKGCPHIDTYNALNKAMEEYGQGKVFSDIGCYTLGALPPFQSINSCVDMGASVTMAKGAADAGMHPSIAVIGDSTFTHSGMTGLLDAVNDNSNVVIMILDNATVAMTGGQHSSALNRLESICKGIGVEEDHIRVLSPLPKNLEENTNAIREELGYEGVSVIIPRRECIKTLSRRMKTKAKKKKKESTQ
ncbi:MAG: indolepyruvate ferredoxin oxidoreductase [Bacteroidales bacterium]|nr:indolepyruvate ferredoxin oxidoreductase [Bacteroidales bacterium]